MRFTVRFVPGNVKAPPRIVERALDMGVNVPRPREGTRVRMTTTPSSYTGRRRPPELGAKRITKPSSAAAPRASTIHAMQPVATTAWTVTGGKGSANAEVDAQWQRHVDRVSSCYSYYDHLSNLVGRSDYTDGMYLGERRAGYEAAQQRQARYLLDQAGV